LYWDGPSDLDLHVEFRAARGSLQRKINYAHKGDPESGFLDVDQNFKSPFVNDPIEHVRWEATFPPAGVYLIQVHGYTLRPAGVEDTPPVAVPFTVEVKSPDGLQTITGVATQGRLVDVSTLTIGITPQQGRRLESVAAGQLEDARKRLEENTPASKRAARSMLLNLIRKFPRSDAAKEANELLRSLK
jgi:hypothetical protein